MSGSKKTFRTSLEMKAARDRGESKTDWARVRSAGAQDSVAVAQNQEIGEVMARKRGRPPLQKPAKLSTTIRFDADVLTALRATGKGWQTRVNEAMREWVKTNLSSGL